MAGVVVFPPVIAVAAKAGAGPVPACPGRENTPPSVKAPQAEVAPRAAIPAVEPARATAEVGEIAEEVLEMVGPLGLVTRAPGGDRVAC